MIKTNQPLHTFNFCPLSDQMITSLSAEPVTTLPLGSCTAAQTDIWWPTKTTTSCKELFTIFHNLAVQSHEEVKNALGALPRETQHTIKH